MSTEELRENHDDMTEVPPPTDGSVSEASDDPVCRICYMEGDAEQPLISPCRCDGSIRYGHQSCLKRWVLTSKKFSCEICGYEYNVQHKLKPIMTWTFPRLSLYNWVILALFTCMDAEYGMNSIHLLFNVIEDFTLLYQ